MDCVVNCSTYSKGRKAASVDIEDVVDLLEQPETFVWIGLQEPSDNMLKRIQTVFGLHDLAIEDAHRAHQRPKIEAYGDILFIVLRTAQMNGQTIDLGETHFFLGSNFLITIRHGSSLSYIDVRARCESTPHLLQKGPAFALYAVMDFIVDQYFPVIDGLEEQLAILEDKIFEETSKRETTQQIYILKRKLLEVKRSVSPLIDICNKLMRFDLRLVDDETRPYFRDVYDHAVRINEMVDNARELLSTALEANLSLVSISQNDVSKRFAGWAAIIGVPTMIAGIYGMNFKAMPELEWSYGYPLVLASIVGTCGLMFYFFRRSGWL
ncbi:MAG TPA: magnesium/cobalt transporter CorA [Chryseolinea sp.]